MLIRIDRNAPKEGLSSLLPEAETVENESLAFYCSDRQIRERYTACTEAAELLGELKGRPGQAPKNSGCFTWLLYDKTSAAVSFGTDSFGLGKLYYRKTGDRVTLADRLSLLTESGEPPLNIDFTAWADFFCFSYLLGDRTFFSEIKTVLPDTYLQLSLSDWALKPAECFSLRYIEENGSISRREAVERCADLLRAAVARAVPDGENLILPLSGGYDSRCLAGILSGRYNLRDCVTFRMDDGSDGDERWSRKTADFLGLQQRFYSVDGDYFLRDLDTYLEEVNFESGMYIDYRAFLHALARDYPQNAVFIDGYGGDRILRLARSGMVAAEPGTEEFYAEFFRKNAGRCLSMCTDARNRMELLYLAKKDMVRELKRCGDRISTFYLYNRNARNISYSLRLEGARFRSAAPFLDWDFVTFALSLPQAVRDEGSFYRDILNRICPGLGDIPSTNDVGASDGSRPIVSNGKNVCAYLRETLGDHWERVGGVYDISMILETLDGLGDTGERLTKLVFPFWMYKRWRTKYRHRLQDASLGEWFAAQREESEFGQAARQSHSAVPFLAIQERRKAEAVWKAYMQENPRPFRNPMKLLLTMDVEGFCGKAGYVRHSHRLADDRDARGTLERLILGGRTGSGRYLLEELTESADLPFTFFVEPYSEAYSRPGEAEAVLQLCARNGHEAALHCHAFALPLQLLEQLGLDWSAYMTEEGLKEILAYGVGLFKRALNGYMPRSFRAGNNMIYPGHFRTLRDCGFVVDASCFLGNSNDHTGTGESVKNAPGPVEAGIYEIPLTAFYDLERQGRIGKLDFNLLGYGKKLECLARNWSAGAKAVTMLFHSWSFTDYVTLCGEYGQLQDKYHGAFSQAAWDELRYLADFVADAEGMALTTCSGLWKEDYQPNPVDIGGTPDARPAYALGPAYGRLRMEEEAGFIPLSEATGSSSKSGAAGAALVKGELVLTLPNEVQPLQGDWAKASFSVKTKPGCAYLLSAELDCPYYKEKFRGRNTIEYSVYVDDARVYSNYVTEPDREELVRHSFIAKTEITAFTVVLRCLADEKPWNWGKAAKLFLKRIHLKRTYDEERIIMKADIQG